MVDEENNVGTTSADRETEQDLNALVAAMIEPRPLLAHCRSMHDTASPLGAWVHTHIYTNGDECEIVPRAFCSEISLAMRVVEKMQERGFRVFIRDYEGVITWEVTFTSHVSATACGNELPEVICRAALKATERLSISDRGTDGQAS